MYALPNKTQHKLIAKVRGGISQKLDNLSAATSFGSATTSPINNNNKNTSISFKTNTTGDFTKSNSSLSPFRASTATLLGKEPAASSSTPTSSKYQFDESVFDSQLNNCLPQPVFHHTNHGNSTASKRFANQRAQKQCITPEHNEMIKYVQQSWKGVERDYKKSVNTYINNIDINSSSSTTATSDHHHNHQLNKQKQGAAGNTVGKKKTATTSTPLLLTGSYHHHTSIAKDSTGSSRQDSFQPFDLETFWGNRILKRLTQDL